MDEEFIFQVTEEELSQFPEEQTTENIEEIGKGEQDEEKSLEGQIISNTKPQNTPIQNKVNIPALLDLKLPRLYAASRNGKCSRQNKEQGQSTGKSRRPRGEWRPRSSTPRKYRLGQRRITPERRRRALGCIFHEVDAISYKRTTEILSPDGYCHRRTESEELFCVGVFTSIKCS